MHISPAAVSLGPTGTPREGAFNVNGMRSTYNNFLMDGLDNNSYGTSNQNYSSQVVQPSPDALAEFRVITSNFSAEYGRVAGGVVNAVMRSGTNQFHGTVYEFLRNTDLNAIGYFLARVRIRASRTFHRNQFGATFGGPVIKDKLFFFVDYEGLRQAQGLLNFYSVPSTNDRAGILPVTVVNPLTGTVYPAGHADSRGAVESIRSRGACRSRRRLPSRAAPTTWRPRFRSPTKATNTTRSWTIRFRTT